MIRKLRAMFDRRGVSPVLTSLLLTVVAVAAMAVATTATYVITTDLRESMSERLVVEDVWFDNMLGTMRIYLRNVGKVAIHVASVYVNNSARQFSEPFDLEAGDHAWLNVTSSWIFDDLFHLDIVTTRGTHVGGFFKAS